jgi:hypothetical protein
MGGRARRPGDEISLGTGTLFTEMATGVPKIGLRPGDDRDEQWLDVPGLYRCHNQTVRLIFTSALSLHSWESTAPGHRCECGRDFPGAAELDEHVASFGPMPTDDED